MNKIWKILAVVLIGIGGADLLFGNAKIGDSGNTGILPTFLTNILTQQWDFILIAGGGLLWWYL